MKLRALALIGVLLLSLALAAPATADRTAQWIVVGVPTANATTGSLTAYQRVGQQWKVVLGPIPAKVGALGVGAPADGGEPDVGLNVPVNPFECFGRQRGPRGEDAAQLLLDEARILDGELPTDAKAFSQRLARIMRPRT